MPRTTIMLSEELLARLRLQAEAEGTSLAEAVRRAVEKGLESDAGRRRLSFAASGSGPADLAEHADDYLSGVYQTRDRQRREPDGRRRRSA